MHSTEGKPRRKRLLPRRKQGFPLWGLPVLLLPLSSPSAAESTDLATALKSDAERRVQDYARRRGWVNFEYQVEPWVPGAAGRQEPCNEPINVGPAQESGRLWGRISYVLSCPDPVWEIRARAEVSLRVPVVTARRNISRGETLNHQTMALKVLDLASIYGDFVTDSRLLAGQRTRRGIRGGQAITLDQATAPLLVERGDNVAIQVAADGVEASMSGEALQSGSRGQGIRVRNHSSGKVITAWVAGKGVVETRF